MMNRNEPELEGPRPQSGKVLGLAQRVIAGSSAERPADQVLRHTLASEPAISPMESRQVSEAVFAYYRWRGWLKEGHSSPEQIKEALRLETKFAKEPQTFSDGELLERAIPGWVKEQVEVSAAWACSLQRKPNLWLRARPGQGAALARKLGHCFPFGGSSLGDAIQYRGREDLFRTPEFHAGQFELQDLSSQAVSLVCAPKSGEHWWDACAGEGGKTLHLADLMENKGLILATDRSGGRLHLLKRRTARARVFNYRAALWNGGPKLPFRTKFDGVLVDAPCSGVGTWQRNPHARWTTTEKDVRELSELQQRLLDHVAPAVKPGGKLVYAVCTMTRAETVEVARAFEEKHKDFSPAPIRNPLEQEAPGAEHLWIWPQQHGGNGMFVAAWTRSA